MFKLYITFSRSQPLFCFTPLDLSLDPNYSRFLLPVVLSVCPDLITPYVSPVSNQPSASPCVCKAASPSFLCLTGSQSVKFAPPPPHVCCLVCWAEWFNFYLVYELDSVCSSSSQCLDFLLNVYFMNFGAVWFVSWSFDTGIQLNAVWHLLVWPKR